MVIDDLDGDDFYDISEGLGGITIEATGANGTFVTISWASGRYQLVLPNGIYKVSFSGDGIDGTITQDITIAGNNVKPDARADEAVEDEEPLLDSEPETPPVVIEGKILSGGTGDDDLTGGAGEDELRGMQGNDTIQGGSDSDQIWSASGIATAAMQSGSDYILDFGDGNSITLDTFSNSASLEATIEIV